MECARASPRCTRGAAVGPILLALLCCRLSFCHRLATAGPDGAWSTGADRYLARSFAQAWHCDVATDACWAAADPATGVPCTTFTGIELWALCSACSCLLLVVRPSRRRPSAIPRPVCVGLLGIGWLGFAMAVAGLASPAPAAWGIAMCPVLIALLLAMPRLRSRIPAATAR